LEAELVGQLGVDIELIRGGGGVFDVVANGQLIFSKQKESRFPETSEIFTLLSELPDMP
jgi:selT/selW/selH-like putative selenoprotein